MGWSRRGEGNATLAVKYKHTRGIAERRAARVTPWYRTGGRPPIGPRHKLLVIYLGLAAAGMAILLLSQMHARFQFLDVPLVYGAAEILAIVPEAAETRVHLRVPVTAERWINAWGSVPADTDALVPGDWVAVRYRISRDRRELRIEACGLVALPPKTR